MVQELPRRGAGGVAAALHHERRDLDPVTDAGGDHGAAGQDVDPALQGVPQLARQPREGPCHYLVSTERGEGR